MSSLKFPWSEQQEDHVQAIRKEMRKFKPDVIAVSPAVMQSLLDRMNRIDELIGRGNGHKLADIGLTLWRAKVGRGAAWCYAETLNDALFDALSRAATSAT